MSTEQLLLVVLADRAEGALLRDALLPDRRGVEGVSGRQGMSLYSAKREVI